MVSEQRYQGMKTYLERVGYLRIEHASRLSETGIFEVKNGNNGYLAEGRFVDVLYDALANTTFNPATDVIEKSNGSGVIRRVRKIPDLETTLRMGPTLRRLHALAPARRRLYQGGYIS